MANNSQVNIGIKFKTDSKEVEQSLNKLKKSLLDIQKIKPGNFSGTKDELEKIKSLALVVEKALNKAFNPTLSMTNLNTFHQELSNNGIEINKLAKDMARLGPQGSAAFNKLATEVLTTNLKLKLTHSLIDSMGDTMVKTIKWGIASSVMNSFFSSVQGAFSYVQSLEKSLTNIRIVTGDSTLKMAQFADQANRSAIALGRSTLDYTKASLTFYQQGLSDLDVQARTEATLKAQNITGVGQEMADYLTSVWNGYKVANELAELYVDKLAAVADSSASDMSELAIAMSKVASTAHTMGVDVDQLNGMIATVVATTRQAPEAVGTAFKTIFSRMNDIKSGAEDAEISLGNYSGKMALLGFNVLDATGHLRDTGLVMEEIGGRWLDLTKEQQIYLAQTMGGQRQVNQLMALFDNWTTYSELLNTSLEAEGTLAQKNSVYMESLGAKMEQLGAAGERVKEALIDEEELKGGTLILTNFVNLIANFVESIGGGSNALMTFGSIALNVFSGPVSKELYNIITNFQAIHERASQLDLDFLNVQKFAEELDKGFGSNSQKDVVGRLLERKEEIKDYYKLMSNEEINIYNNLIKEEAEHFSIQKQLEEKRDSIFKIEEAIQSVKGSTDLVGKSLLEAFNADNLQTTLGEVASSIEEIFYDEIRTLKTNDLDDLKNKFNLLLNVDDATKFLLLNSQGFDKLQLSFNNSSLSVQDLRNNILAFYTQALEGIQNLDPAIRQSIIDNLKMALFETDNCRKKVELFQRSIQQLSSIRTYTEMAAGIAQLASGVRNVINLTKIWKNENLSLGLKLLQTFTNVSMTLGMLLNGITKTIKGFGKIQKGVLAYAYVVNHAKGEGISFAAAQIAAQEGLQVEYVRTGAKAWLSLGPYIVAAGAVAAAVWLIVKAYQAWNKEANNAQLAAKVANETKKAYEDLKTSLDNVKSSLEDLHSAEKNLNDLTIGTQEWRDALQECNDKILELIANYPLLGQYVSNLNGRLKLSAEGEKAYLERLLEGVQNAQNSSYLTSSRARAADARATAEQIGHNSLYQRTSLRRDYTYAGAKASDTLPEHASTDAVMKVVESLDKVLDKETIDLKDGLLQLTERIAEETDLLPEEVSAILSNKEEVLKLRDQLQQNEIADKLMYETMALNALMDNSTYKSMNELEKQVTNVIGENDLKTNTDNIEKEILGLISNEMTRWTQRDNPIVLDILRRLNDAQETNWRMDSNAVRANGYLAFRDLGNNLKVLPKLQIAATIAAHEALLKLSDSAETATNVLQKINNSELSSSEQTGLMQFIAKNGINGTSTDVKNLLNLNMDESLLQNIFGENYELTIKNVGYSSAKDFIQAFTNLIQTANTEFQNIGEFALKPVQTALNDKIRDKGFLLETEKNFEKAFSNVFERVGSSGIDSLIAIKDLAGEDVDTVAKLFAQADLTTSEGLNLLEKDLQDIDAKAILTSKDWATLKNEIQNSQFENPLDTIFDNQNIVNGITKDLKKYSIISEDDYNKLQELDAGVASFFKRVADGYEFIGSKPKLLDLLVGTNPDYITAANQFDAIKLAAEDVSKIVEDSFENNQVNNAEKLSISGKVGLTRDIIDLISNKENSEDIWAALGFDEEHIQTVKQEFLDLLKVSPSLRDLTWQTKYDERLAILNKFVDKAKELPAYLQESTETLRSAAALNAQTMTELVGMLDHNLINGDQFGMALQAVSQREMENLGFDPEKYEEYVKLLQSTNELYANNEYLARQVAAANMRISLGTQDLIDNWKDWDATFKDFLASGRDIGVLADKWGEFKETLANLFDMDKESFDLLGPNFVADNLDKIEAVKDGIPGAYEGLSDLIEENLWGKLENSIQSHKEANDIDLGEGITIDYDSVLESSQGLFDQLLQFSEDATIEVGTSIDDTNLINGLNNMIDASGMASDQMAAIFDSMGYDVEFQAKDPSKHSDSENIEYYVPPTYTMQDLGDASLGFAGLSLPVKVPVIAPGGLGHYESVSGEKETYLPGTYAIKTITKNGKGNGGNISRKKANAPSNNSGKGNKGNKGGGGNKGKQGTTSKPATDKADRYRNNTVKMNKLTNQLVKLQKESNELEGKDKIKNLEKQRAILQEQNKTIRERINLQRDLQKLLANNLKNFGATFDPDGTLNNYFDVHAKILDEYNKKVAEWNSHANKDDGWQEAHKDYLNDAKAIMDQALKDLAQYDKLQQEIADKQQEQLDNLQKQIDLKVQRLELKIEATLDLAKLKRDWNSFKRDIIEDIRDDDILGLNNYRFADINSYFNSNKTGSIQQLANKLATITKNSNGTFTAEGLAEDLSKLSKTDKEARLKEIESISNSLFSEMTDFKELVDDIKNSIFDAIDAAQEAFDLQMDEYEFLGDTLEHNKKLILLMYGDKAYAAMDKYYSEIQKNNNNQLDFLVQEKDLWYSRMEEDKARMEQFAKTEGVDSNNYKDALKRFKELEKHWMDSVKNLNTTLEDAIQNIIDKYNNALNQIFLDFEKSIGNGHTLDGIRDEWDMLNEKADMYFDKINSAYELDKLGNAFEDAIKENEGNIAAQQSLNDLMEQQLGYLRDKDKLTQYDVDRANTLLQIEIKRLALLQSRSNKNKLRLRRDSQGNYTYQYTADTESINKAEQELADARNSLYNSDKAAYVDNLNSLQKSADNIKQKLYDIWTDTSLTDEQRQQKSYELYKYYGEQINDLMADNATIRNNLMESSFAELAKMAGISLDELRAMSKLLQDQLFKDLIPQANSWAAGLVDSISGEGGFLSIFEEWMNSLRDAKEQEKKEMSDTMDVAHKNVDDIVSDTDVLALQIRKLLEPNKALVEKHKEEIEQVQEYINYLGQVLNIYEKIQEQASKAMSAAYAVLKADAAGLLDSSFNKLSKTVSKENKARTDYFKNNNSGSDLGPDYVPYEPNWQSTNFAAMFGSSNVDEISMLHQLNADKIKNDSTLTEEQKQKALEQNDTVVYSYIKDINLSKVLSSLDEGVLSINAQLNAIYLANEAFFKSSLEKQDDIQKAITNQTIQISADFPNAKDVQSIIQAIESLPEKAAQYAGKI